MSAVLADRITQEHAAAAASLPAAVLPAERRAQALASLTAAGMPTVREENWKYANLRVLEKVRFAPRAGNATHNVTATDLPPALTGYSRYVFVDGVFAPALSSDAGHSGVSIRTFRADSSAPLTISPRGGARNAKQHIDAKNGGSARTGRGHGNGAAASTLTRGDETVAGAGERSADSAPNTQADSATDRGTVSADTRLALLNEVFATDAASVLVAAGTDCAACLEIVFVATDEGDKAASYPRLELHVESDARLGLIERHVSVGSDANFVNAAIDVRLERGASVDHYRIQKAGARAVWFDTLTASVAQSASYRLHAVSLGALAARSTIHTVLEGEGAEVELRAVSLAGQRQVHDSYSLVEHAAPNTRSEQSFRGIASERARTAFNSKVVVRKGAKRADSHQSLRGLLAGPEAEIDVRPQLEIYTDDVKCNHGATTGKLDDQMLFYLLSRGIDRETAQGLLKWAFLEDVVSKISVPELRRQIELSLAGQLNERIALEELL
jgi:FeS assembly protein SufD